MGDLLAASKQYGGSLVILSLSTDLAGDTTVALQQYRTSHSITWTIARDTQYVYYYKYNVTVAPALFLIDSDGYIRYTHVGYTGVSVLSAEIRAIPEFPVLMIPLLFMIPALVVVASRKLMKSRGRRSAGSQKCADCPPLRTG